MPLAVKGHAPSQYNLGVMHEWGNGVPKDYVKAMKWYRLSAEGSHKDAQNNLGAIYSILGNFSIAFEYPPPPNVQSINVPPC